ncbi:MAG: hypothetical protein SFY80_10435 [Verrucomicrobiota bacterium]|nr:hypothetical protein [Verrucomicrobiota bacterium]
MPSIQFTLSTKNTFAKSITDARVWVFAMDAEGKVVGNKAEWVIGGKKDGHPALESGKTENFSLVVPTSYVSPLHLGQNPIHKDYHG